MLNLDRTPWHMTWVGVRPQRARRRLDGARVSARSLPVERSWSFRRRAPRHGCQPCLRGSRLSSRVPPALSLSASRLSGTHSARTVRPTGTCRAPATNAAGWVWVRSAASTKRGWQAPLTSPFRHATRPSQARLAGAPGETRKRCHTTLVPILHQVKVKRSYQPGGQGRRADGRGQGRLFLDSREMPHSPRARQFAEHLLPTRG